MRANGCGNGVFVGSSRQCKFMDFVRTIQVTVFLQPRPQLSKFAVVIGAEIALFQHIAEKGFVRETRGEGIGFRVLTHLLGGENVAIELHICR